ncbi:MAG: hypothetical protein J6B89_00835 [Bacilli bacterium]|nr:hypothetical protein [Bacilli bacterium]
MLKLSLLQQMIIVAVAMSTITCSFIQKTKKYLKKSKLICLYSFVVNMVTSVIFCITFTEVKFPESLWVGLFSFIGADTLYKSLEGKVKSYKDVVTQKSIEVPIENLINIEEDE